MIAKASVAATATAVAGVVHVVAGPTHAAGPWWHIAGFVAVGLAQLVAASLLLRGAPGSRVATAALHLAALTAWIWFQTLGLPGVVSHPVGLADAVVVGLQVITLALLLAPGASRSPMSRRRWAAPAAATAVSLLLVATAGGIAVADLLDHGHHEESSQHAREAPPAGTTLGHGDHDHDHRPNGEDGQRGDPDEHHDHDDEHDRG